MTFLKLKTLEEWVGRSLAVGIMRLCNCSTLQCFKISTADEHSTQTSIALDFQKVIQRNLKWKAITESYINTIQRPHSLLSSINVIHPVLIPSYALNMRKKKKQLPKVNTETVVELNMLFPSDLAHGALEETTLLCLQTDSNSKRKSARWKKLKISTHYASKIYILFKCIRRQRVFKSHGH